MILNIMFFILVAKTISVISNYKEIKFKNAEYVKKIESLNLDSTFLKISLFRDQLIAVSGVLAFIMFSVLIHIKNEAFGISINMQNSIFGKIIDNSFMLFTIFGFSIICIKLIDVLLCVSEDVVDKVG